jgi:hypothetical protein
MGAAAYAIYNFLIPGYDRNAQLRCGWASEVNDAQHFVGLANWDADSWDFFPGSAEPKLNFPSLDPYLRADGRLLVVLLCLGQENETLDSVRIGSLPPTAALSVTPQQVFVPVEMAADASGSSDPDGTIVKYEWDLNNNGIFETSSGADPILEQERDSGAFGRIAVRVTDDDGLSATASQGYTLFEEWIHSYGGPSFDRIHDVAYDQQGAIYLLASTSSFGLSNDQLLARLDLSGAVVWARGWDGGHGGLTAGLGFIGDGRIVCSGTINAETGNGQSAYVQTWSPEGELISSRFFDSLPQYFPADMLVSGATAYIAGVTGGFAQMTLVRFGLDDNSVKIAAIAHPSVSFFQVEDMALRHGFSNTEIHVAGSYHVGTDSQAFVASFGDSQFSGSLAWSSASALGPYSRAHALSLRGSVLTEFVVAGSVFVEGSGTQAFISSLEAGSPVQSIWNTTTVTSDAAGLLVRPDGGFCMTGTNSGDTFLYEFSSTGVNELALELRDGFQDTSFYSHLESLGNFGMLTAGECSHADTLDFSAAPGLPLVLTQTWLPATFDPVTIGPLTTIDLPGTVTSLTDIVVDSGAGDRDGLVLTRRMSISL